MADSYSSLLRFRLQQTGNNNNSWGGLLNSAAIQLIESSIAGTAPITLAGSDVTLSTANGANDQARCAVLLLQGSPGAARNVIIPSLSKTYIVNNMTDQIITIKTAAAGGTVVAVTAAAVTLVVCDGTNVIEVTPQSAGTATNALALGGVSANQWARLNATQAFSKGQKMLGVDLAMGATVDVDLAEGNIFTGVLTANTAMNAPLNTDATNAQDFKILLQQAPAGGPFTVSFDSTYDFITGAPVMPSDPGAFMMVIGTWIPALGKAICIAAVESATTLTGFTLSANEQNVDIFRRLGSPSGAVNVTITVAAGVVISSATAALAAMDFSGGFASGSTVNLINLGYILGRGGDGDHAPIGFDLANSASASIGYGPPIRKNGGNAIRAPGAGITFNITNAGGFIWGGGGGGGRGNGSTNSTDSPYIGGAGGGGAGLGKGGLGVTLVARGSSHTVTGGAGSDGAQFLDGSSSSGAGGAAQVNNGSIAGAGGPGGDFGNAGAGGTTAGGAGSNTIAATSGGNPGKAVELTGASPTFVNGGSSPNVKGAIS